MFTQLIALVVVTFVAAAFLYLGTSVAGVAGRSYGKALTATGVNFLASWLLNGALGIVGLHSGFIPFALGLALSLFIIKGVFATTWTKAAFAWIIEVIAVLVVIGVPLFLLFGAALLSGHAFDNMLM